MKTRALIAGLVLLLFVAQAGAHIGSPDVFFEGKAGPHALRVSIRPPATLPGAAQVDVRSAGGELTRLMVRPVFWPAGVKSAPAATELERTREGVWHTAVWLLRPGSYMLEISAESGGGAGGGMVAVPLNASANREPSMPVGLGVALVGLVALLASGAVAIAGAAARDSAREPGASCEAEDVQRGRRAMGWATLPVLAGFAALGLRWRAIDAEFRERALDRLLPLAAETRVEGGLGLLQLTPAGAGSSFGSLAPDHGKLMHVFLVGSGPEAFAHLHPVARSASLFENVLPPIPAGEYELYAEITRATGASGTLFARLQVPILNAPPLPPDADARTVNEVWCRPASAAPGFRGQPRELDLDDSWHVGGAEQRAPRLPVQTAKLSRGGAMLFHAPAAGFLENRETTLRFEVFDAEGRRAVLQPYIGMLGHAVVRRADGSVFTHLHPAGTISMAAQEMYAGPNAGMAAPPAGTNDVTFPYAFPKAGEYRLWVQVRVAGRIETAVFAVDVRAE